MDAFRAKLVMLFRTAGLGEIEAEQSANAAIEMIALFLRGKTHAEIDQMIGRHDG